MRSCRREYVRVTRVDRLLFVFAGTFLMAVAAWIWTGLLNLWEPTGAAWLFQRLGVPSLPLAVGGAFLFLVGFHIVFFVLEKNRDGKVVQHARFGDVTIATGAISHVLASGIKEVKGVDDATVDTVAREKGVAVAITLAVRSRRPVHDVIGEVHRKARDVMRIKLGIDVSDIRVNVKNIAPVEANPAPR